ncbi:F-box only protein 6 [Cryptomeria japonica]|uniref:F-box only protein 6 n=1 Tax=Cryptomeria japonica TaxID=3369 RepID=UPI0025ACAEC9|nr:F-box only protein 6 [Cryptomeria japonica]
MAFNSEEVISNKSEDVEESAGDKCKVVVAREQNKALELQAVDLPHHLWENILARLPISSLFRMLSVCRAWNSMVHSDSFMTVYRKVPPQDVYFVLFADYVQRNVVAAYDPLDNTWAVMNLSSISSSSCLCSEACCIFRRGVVSGGGLVVAENRKGSYVVCNLFTKTHKILPAMLPMNNNSPYVVAIVVLSREYKILAVSTDDTITSQVYDSQTNSWKMSGSFDGRFAMVGNAAHLDGFLFCLSYPDNLLAFDLDAGTWHLVEVTMPPLVCPHIMEHDGSLILVGGIEEHRVLKKIGIWELDESVKQWHIVCTMPDHLFSKFSHGNLEHFLTVALCGKICFYKNYHSVIFMYDLSEKKWWGLPPCPLDSRICRPTWFGLALEPRLDAQV